MHINGQALVQMMEELAPKHIAMENDKIGLQLGTLNKPILKAMVALDVTHEVVNEAIEQGANLIIAHHAIIFRPLAKIDTDTAAGSLYEKLIKHDIAVYISHTNLDTAEGGINDWLADQAGISKADRISLEEVFTERMLKLTVFVPAESLQTVQEALWRSGAGSQGDYSECSFVSTGEGSYRPGKDASPYIGKPGQLERTKECRLEVLLPSSLKKKAVQAMLKAHPYEEPAYDIFVTDVPGKSYGLGRCGKLEQPISLEELANKLKNAFEVPMLRVVGDLNATVKKAAVLGGSGARYVNKAKFAGANVLITGDIDYHTAHDALAEGMMIIDAGHNIEKVMKQKVAEYLNNELVKKGVQTELIYSKIHTDPFQFI